MLPLGSPDRIHAPSIWWPMPDCFCRSLWPSIWVWVNCLDLGDAPGRTRGTSC